MPKGIRKTSRWEGKAELQEGSLRRQVVLGGMCRKLKRCDDSESGRSATNGKLAIEGSKRDKKRISSTNQGKGNSKTKKKSGKSRRMKELRRNSVVL